MKEKTPKNRSLNSFLIAISTVVTIFFIYELTIVGNPFFDPIVPYYLWGCFFLVMSLFIFRYLQLIKNKEDL